MPRYRTFGDKANLDTAYGSGNKNEADELVEKIKIIYPYGKSILPGIIKRDPSPWIAQIVSFVSTAIATALFLPVLPSVLAQFFLLNSSWDFHHGVTSVATLFSSSLGLSEFELQLAFGATIMPFFALCIADLIGLRWPANWHTENSKCYDEMFCEPCRPYLVKHVGNTISNLFYLFGGICVILSAPRCSFWMADACFGAMLVLLAIFSVIWHASAAPKSHYADLWSMDCCILYLIIRCLGLALLQLSLWWGLETHIAKSLSSGSCLLVFCVVIILIGKNRLPKMCVKGELDHGCPFSGRNRLYNQGAQETDMPMSGCCLFMGMPCLYMVMPTLVQGFIAGSIGSHVAGSVACISLAAGWGLRMFERFCLDGWAPMNWIIWSFPKPCMRRTLLAAMLSPTAFLHWFTSATLIFGYIHSRSLEDIITS